jgi:branched-chain amino acid transport system permease protein
MGIVATQTGKFYDSYRREFGLHPTRSNRVAAWTAVAVAFGVVPFFASEYWLGNLSAIAVAALGALALNVLTGFTGQISLGTAAFAAVGAYTVGNLAMRYELSPLLALPAAALLTGAVALVVGLAALRIKGLYLAIATLAFQFVVEWLLFHWSEVTGGVQGVISVPRTSLGPLDLNDPLGKYLFIGAVLGLCVVFVENVFRTRIGRAFVAIRDQHVVAAGMGIPVFRYKLAAFFCSSALAGLSGGLYAYYVGLISSEQFGLDLSVRYLAMILIGGLASIPGSVLGAAFVTLIPLFLRDGLPSLGIEFGPGTQVHVEQILFGLTVLVFLVLEPRGLHGLFNNVRDYFRNWPFSYKGER